MIDVGDCGAICPILSPMNTVHSNQTLLLKIHSGNGSQDNAVSTATGYGLDGRGVPVGAKIFSSPRRPDLFWGHPASYPIGIRGSFPGGKAAGA
jgi:hypothetical protein